MCTEVIRHPSHLSHLVIDLDFFTPRNELTLKNAGWVTLVTLVTSFLGVWGDGEGRVGFLKHGQLCHLPLPYHQPVTIVTFVTSGRPRSRLVT